MLSGKRLGCAGVGNSPKGAASADFRRTNLAGADFTGADLQYADFSYAVLDQAAFGGSLLCTILTLNYRPQMATVRPRVMAMPVTITSGAFS